MSTLVVQVAPRHDSPSLGFTLLLSALTALTALSIDMSLPALPQLQQAFHADVSHAQLTLSLFLAGFGVSQFICGPLSDHYGRRPVLLSGLVLFTLSGFACAAAHSLAELLVCRTIQGAGASVGPILTRAIIRDLYDQRMSSGILSHVTQVMVAAPILAPTAGGLLIHYWGWPSIFLVLGCCGAAVTLIAWLRLAETLQRHEHSGQVRRVFRSYGVVLTHRATLKYVLATCFSYGGLFAYVSGSPFVYMEVYGVSRQHFGYYFALPAIALLIGAAVNRRLLHKYEPIEILRVGVFLVTAAGALVLAATGFNVGGLAGVIMPIMLYLFGIGLLAPNAVAMALSYHGSIAGVASSLMGGLQTLSGAVTAWLVGYFYHHNAHSLAATLALAALFTLLSCGCYRSGGTPARRVQEQPEDLGITQI